VLVLRTTKWSIRKVNEERICDNEERNSRTLLKGNLMTILQLYVCFVQHSMVTCPRNPNCV